MTVYVLQAALHCPASTSSLLHCSRGSTMSWVPLYSQHHTAQKGKRTWAVTLATVIKESCCCNSSALSTAGGRNPGACLLIVELLSIHSFITQYSFILFFQSKLYWSQWKESQSLCWAWDWVLRVFYKSNLAANENCGSKSENCIQCWTRYENRGYKDEGERKRWHSSQPAPGCKVIYLPFWMCKHL